MNGNGFSEENIKEKFNLHNDFAIKLDPSFLCYHTFWAYLQSKFR